MYQELKSFKKNGDTTENKLHRKDLYKQNSDHEAKKNQIYPLEGNIKRMVQSQREHPQYIANQKRRIAKSNTYLGRNSNESDLEIIQNKGSCTKETFKPQMQGKDHPMFKNCFETDMKEFTMKEGANQSFNNNQAFFMNKIFTRRNPIDSLIFSNKSNMAEFKTQKFFLPLKYDQKLINNKVVHDNRNLQGKRSYQEFAKRSGNKQSKFIKVLKQEKNNYRLNSSKVKFGNSQELNDELCIKKKTRDQDFIEVQIDFRKTLNNEIVLGNAKENLKVTLNNFLEEHKGLVSLSIKASSSTLLDPKNYAMTFNPIHKEVFGESQQFNKVEQIHLVPEVLNKNNVLITNVIQNSFLRNVAPGNIFIKQLQNSLTAVIKLLLQNDTISYNKENIFTLLNLQMPLKPKLFQGMSIKARVKIVCMMFAKFINSKAISNICQEFFIEIDFQNIVKLKRILLR